MFTGLKDWQIERSSQEIFYATLHDEIKKGFRPTLKVYHKWQKKLRAFRDQSLMSMKRVGMLTCPPVRVSQKAQQILSKYSANA